MPKRMLVTMLVAMVVAVGMVACADEPSGGIDRDTLSQRQKDSLIGASSLPGAHGVRGAIGAADSAAARAARLDSADQP